MTYSNIDLHLFEDIVKANNTSNCELRYVLRILLSRGAEEAHFRCMLSNGQKAQAYEHLKLMLLRVIDDLEVAVTENGSIVYHHRNNLRQTLAYTRHLIAIEREETASQFEYVENEFKTRAR